MRRGASRSGSTAAWASTSPSRWRSHRAEPRSASRGCPTPNNRSSGCDGFDATQLILAAVAPSHRLEVPCPYPGMRPYTADDAKAFHGRAAEIDELLGRLRAGEREIYVIG